MSLFLNKNRSIKEDYEFGKEKEIEIFETIKKYFNDDITFIQYKYSTYDYKGTKSKYELKSRTNKYKAFPTTLIPEYKIKYNTNIHFLFYFTDGLYFIKYDKQLFDTFELKEFVRNKRIDYDDKPQLYFFIPIKYLVKIN